MTTLRELVDNNLNLLRKGDEVQFGFKALIHDHEGEENEGSQIPMDMEIQALLEQLTKVKHNERNLLTYELFLERVLTSSTTEEALPTPSELAQSEFLLREEKVKLRSIKGKRAKVQEELAKAAEKIDAFSSSRDRARTEFQCDLENADAAAKLEVVKNAIESGDMAEMEKLIANIDSYDAKACEMILREVALQHSQNEKEAKEESEKADALQGAAAKLEKDVSELERSTTELQATISQNDKENSTHAAMRHECAMQEQLTEMLAALSGVRVTEVRTNGMTFKLNANVFAGPRSSGDRSVETHTLEIEFGSNEVGDTVIAFMHLEPGDVTVSDIREELGMSLYTGIGKVCERLRAGLSRFTEVVPATP